MLSLRLDQVQEVALLAAHCDDLLIGAGATLAGLAEHRPDLRVRALVMTGGDTEREAEERKALTTLLPRGDLGLTVLNLPDGRLPEHWGPVKSAVNALARDTSADLVIAPQRHDAHQDHQLIGEIVFSSFRDHAILGYETPKWESDLPHVNFYHPVSAASARVKVQTLADCYPSQAEHDWFDSEVFMSLMRIRGVQCRSIYAEAFVAEKLVVTAG